MLSEAEKAAGREFRSRMREQLDALHVADPPTYLVPDVIALYRHKCPARGMRSTALELKEIYAASPIYPAHDVPAGRFGWIYREGRCRGCGQSARSGTGRLVDGWQRPPLSGRVARS